MKASPCFGCDRRTIGCHGKEESGEYKCQAFGAWKAAYNAEADARRAGVKAHSDLMVAKRKMKQLCDRISNNAKGGGSQ